MNTNKNLTRKIVNIRNKSLKIDISPITPSKEMSFATTSNPYSTDSDRVMIESLNNSLSLQYRKKPLKPGSFSTKSFDNYIPRLRPRNAKWEGPQQDFEAPNLEFEALDSFSGQPNNRTINSSKRFGEILEKYLNHEYDQKTFLEKEQCKVIYKNLDNKWISASNPEKDYYDCFGYNLGSIPTVDQQGVLENKTGNPGTLVPHELKINILFLPPRLKFKSTNPVNIQSYRILNNGNLEPKKCVSFPTPGKYSR